MTKRRSVLLGAAFLLAASVPVVLVAAEQSEPAGTPQFAGGGFALPHETPFPAAQRVSLSTARAAATFPIVRPAHPLANDDVLTDVWLRQPAPDDDADIQVALWYSSGLEIHLSPVSPGDKAPLIADFPDDFPVTYETIGGVEARVIPPGVQGPGQSGSVTMVKDGVLVSLFGWLPDLTVDELRDIASTVGPPTPSPAG